MEKPSVIGAVGRLVAHVESVIPVAGQPHDFYAREGVYTVDAEWIREFERLDASLDQLCIVKGISIESGSRIATNILEDNAFWFLGKTNLKFRYFNSPEPDEGSIFIANRSDWLRRMDLVRIRAEITEDPPLPNCRLRVEDSKDGWFIYLDERPIPAKEGAGKLFQCLIESDGEAISMTETGCKSRDLKRLPTSLLELLDRKTGGGTRLKREAWRS